jgi:hypothetical protein
MTAGYVDDREPPHPNRRLVAEAESLVIWTAVDERRDHTAHRVPIDIRDALRAHDAGDAAHQARLPRMNVRSRSPWTR